MSSVFYRKFCIDLAKIIGFIIEKAWFGILSFKQNQFLIIIKNEMFLYTIYSKLYLIYLSVRIGSYY